MFVIIEIIEISWRFICYHCMTLLPQRNSSKSIPKTVQYFVDTHFQKIKHKNRETVGLSLPLTTTKIWMYSFSNHIPQ